MPQLSTIYLATDHRGYELKQQLLSRLELRGDRVVDLGAKTHQPTDDYPTFAADLGLKVATDSQSSGIIICGSGVGVCVAANKIRGVRAGLGFSVDQVIAARRDDQINVLCLAADYYYPDQAWELCLAFLETEYQPNQARERRLQQIRLLELAKSG